MHNHPQAYAAFVRAISAGCKAAIFTKDGRLLAYDNWDAVRNDPGVLGHGWREWLTPSDGQRVEQWLAEASDTGPIVYRVVLPDRSITTCLVKAWMDGAWLVVGCETVKPGEPAGSASPFGSSKPDLAE